MSKTGTQDDTVIFGNFDVDLVALAGPLLRGRAAGDLLFGAAMGEREERFEQAARDLLLTSHNLVTYQARHGGATRDVVLKRRELEEVRKRGR